LLAHDHVLRDVYPETLTVLAQESLFDVPKTWGISTLLLKGLYCSKTIVRMGYVQKVSLQQFPAAVACHFAECFINFQKSARSELRTGSAESRGLEECRETFFTLAKCFLRCTQIIYRACRAAILA